jgi:hypothetical protein
VNNPDNIWQFFGY